jgi:hypothetical protein
VRVERAVEEADLICGRERRPLLVLPAVGPDVVAPADDLGHRLGMGFAVPALDEPGHAQPDAVQQGEQGREPHLERRVGAGREGCRDPAPAEVGGLRQVVDRDGDRPH